MVAAENWKTKGTEDATMAEAQVLNRSFDLAHAFCFKSIIFEMDREILSKALKTTMSPRNYWGSIFSNIKRKLVFSFIMFGLLMSVGV